MIDASYKAPAGPRWVSDAKPGACDWYFEGKPWRITKVENNGRVIHWVSPLDGRVARTEIMPEHPDYPKDLTREQQQAKAAGLKEKKKQFFRTFGRWPTDAEIGA